MRLILINWIIDEWIGERNRFNRIDESFKWQLAYSPIPNKETKH